MINLSQLIKGRKKLFFVISAISALMLPSIWFGLGHVIAKQALAVPHGCGMWESNTPTNWTVDDDWEPTESNTITKKPTTIMIKFSSTTRTF